MSIKPKYAKKIISGEKTIELRKNHNRLHIGDTIVFYESSPTKKITFYCTIKNIIYMSPSELWNNYSSSFGIDFGSYNDYFNDSKLACGIELSDVIVLSKPQPIKIISENIKAPQSYRYISNEQFLKIIS